MKRLLIPFVAAFGLSLGVATGVRMMRAPKAAIASPAKLGAKPDSQHVNPADSAGTGAPTPTPLPNHAAVDSSAAAAKAAAPTTTRAATTPAATTPAATTPTVPAPPATPAVATETRAHVPGTVMEPPQKGSVAGAVVEHSAPVKAVAAQVKAAGDSAVGHRLGKVFAAMQARDAARVLEQMEDTDVQVILASLSNKQQAAILGSFPTQRAATIMRSTLRNSAGGVQ